MHVQESVIPYYLLLLLPAVTGLLGIIAGLAMKKFKKFRNFQDILKAIGFYFVVNILYNWMIGELEYFRVEAIIIQLISGSIFLAVLMIAFAKIVRQT